MLRKTFRVLDNQMAYKDIPRVSAAHNTLANMSRWLCRSAIVALLLLGVGCASASGPFKKLHLPIGGNSKEQVLRKQVEADSFPTAQQSGL